MERLNAEFQFADNLARQQLDRYYRFPETECVKEILAAANLPESIKLRIETSASVLIESLRKAPRAIQGVAAFMTQYQLSSVEGIALMCLAESLLRIPDKATRDKLISDKLLLGDWRRHLGKSHSLLVNAATWGLVITGYVVETSKLITFKNSIAQPLKNFLRRTQAPIVRQALHSAIQLLGKQFVIATDIKTAIKYSQSKSLQAYRFSFDMLGEAAYTKQDAERYYRAYVDAIKALAASGSQSRPIQGPGISVKLSALHPRFSFNQIDRLKKELLPNLCELITLAKEANIGLTIDAEEAHTLLLNFELVKAIIETKILTNWQGLGIAVQAYQKRAPYLLDAIIELLRVHQQRMMIRLVKGAYWDTEIKLAQIQGLNDYPVFTRKVATDVNYLVCAKRILAATDVVYPQFATHNALTVSAIIELAKDQHVTDYEFQCLYGMGEELYTKLNEEGGEKKPCRIYAPVGTHEDLLAYLVRRLLENGANSSFVNKITDKHIPLAQMVVDPEQQLAYLTAKPHPKIKLPPVLYLPERLNSLGVDLSNPREFLPLLTEVEALKLQEFNVTPTTLTNEALLSEARYSPIDSQHLLGNVSLASTSVIEKTLNCAEQAFKTWECDVVQRNQRLIKMAELLQTNRTLLLALLIYEGGKTVEDAIAELREAIDYCYYYAAEMLKCFQNPIILPGPTGEHNFLSLHARGIIVCISPWNFPLAIFLGQITAALAAGNVVIAKPASQTMGIAGLAINLLHKAGFPKEVVQLLPAAASLIAERLLSDRPGSGVVFTGSTTTAQKINEVLAKKPGSIVPFIAETGGQNAMIVDSSALPEQVTHDVITSAFRSAGQRCSALRVLFVQQEIADKIINVLVGAMANLKVGHPLALATDIGPVIDEAAKEKLISHSEKIKRHGKLLFAVSPSVEDEKGSYFSPHLYEISHLNVLTEEVFGPILHVIRFAGNELDNVINQINATGFGLTLGIHSRINTTVNYITQRAKVGNIYVNRNMIGAVVGVQPFGGEGLSGTGPKAGGPALSFTLSGRRTISVNTTASGGNAQLLMMEEN